jgi:two-component system response regulator HydG
MTRARVLVVDDKESVLELMKTILGGAHEVATTPDPAQAMTLLEHQAFDVVLTDVRMPGATGFDLLAAAKRSPADPSVIMMTGYASIPDAIEAIRRGAFDYVPKPIEAEEISLVVARAAEQRAKAAAETTYEKPAVAGQFRDAIASARDRASRDYLAALLRQFNGNVTRAATHAGMTRESLHRLLRKYGVRSEDFKPTSS